MVNQKAPRTCGTCDGDKMCHTCWNAGRIIHPNPKPEQVGSYITCPTCGGKKQCGACNGSGQV